MSHKKIQELATKFATKIEDIQTNPFHKQRMIVDKFYDLFSKIYMIYNKIMNDIDTLRKVGFPNEKLHKFVKIAQYVENISKEVQPYIKGEPAKKPYLLGEKFVKQISDPRINDLLIKLTSIAQKHINDELIKIEVRTGKTINKPEITSLISLKHLAGQLKNFMETNPLIELPSKSTPPPPRLIENLQDVPSFFAGKEDPTNPGFKKRL